ncbi:MAG: tetratricopeptide repeat protein [Acidobacteria bacterium]|nr:tetratricopeptide repeat protein [Acidobacteriota bacterium]
MPADRLDALKTLIELDPANHFARYGLAQALASAGRVEEAVAAYKDLMDFNPDYVAAYYHSGQALEKLGRVEEARGVYQQGIDACNRTGDTHTRNEIQAALDLLA